MWENLPEVQLIILNKDFLRLVSRSNSKTEKFQKRRTIGLKFRYTVFLALVVCCHQTQPSASPRLDPSSPETPQQAVR